MENLNKHFTPLIASKINWTINFIFENCSISEDSHYQPYIQYDKVRNLKEDQQLVNIWEGKDDIVSFICDAFEKWILANDKANGRN